VAAAAVAATAAVSGLVIGAGPARADSPWQRPAVAGPQLPAQDAQREAQLVATEDSRLHTLLATMNHKTGKHAAAGPELERQGLTTTLVLPPPARSRTSWPT
jgi:anti-sigma-K factor RskA